MVIAIDGPAGAGKSTVARAVAERLGYTYLDSGAMYRCVALLVGEIGGDPAALAEAATIELGERVLLDGRDVTEAIRTPAVSEAASQISADIGVRMALVRKQQELLRDGGDWVAEGRDIGTVVCPDAQVKVFLTASPEVRARRRARASGDAVRKTLTSACGQTTVPMSRPSATQSPSRRICCCLRTSAIRTPMSALTCEEASEIAGVRIASVTSRPSSSTRSPSSIRAASATAAGSPPRSLSASATARYIAPVSRYV